MKKLLTVLIATATIPAVGHAFTLNYKYEGGTLIGQNEIQLSGEVQTSSDWRPISGIDTTKQWQPGIISTADTRIEMKGVDGMSTFDFPIELLGMQYNVGGSSQNEAASIVSGGACDSASGFAGQIATLYAQDSNSFAPTIECYADFSLTTQSGVAEQPFYFIRPVYSLTQQKVDETIDNLSSDLPAGKYTGSVPIQIRYYYKSAGGATTFRVINESISIQFDYQPAILNSVTITGEEEIEPVYDTGNNTASGSTTFTVSADGYFSNGLVMTFVDTGPFTLTSAGGIDINYSITCGDCDTPNLVVDGVLKTTSTVIPGSGLPNITYDLQFSYSNVAVEDIESGTYEDTVTLIFEENI